MENKYSMTVEENIFVAKRNLVDYIWKSANLEGIAVTYPHIDGIQFSKTKENELENNKAQGLSLGK